MHVEVADGGSACFSANGKGLEGRRWGDLGAARTSVAAEN